MGSKIIKFLVIVGLGFMVTTYNACSSPYSSSSSSSEAARDLASLNAFKTNLHGVLENQCSQCHGTFQNPLFAVSDGGSAYEAVVNNSLVDLSRPDASYFITKLAEGHNNFQSNVIDQIRAGIQSWARVVEDYDALNPTPGGAVVDFKVASDSSVLSKVKLSVHGGAVTEDELNTYNQASDKQDALKRLIDTWSDTPEGNAKLTFYLRNALNQDLSNSEDLFRDGNVTRLHASMRQSFTRTAIDIIDRNRPFTEIATTNRFAVNTALLSAYAWMDRRSTPRDRDMRINRYIRDNTISSDFTDWRFVTFNQDDNEGESYQNLDFWRDVPNNGRVNFSIPRVGYYSTLAFQANYPTNGDNQFRVTINQALIAGLSRTFSPSDNTNQPNMVHMDEDHSERGSECFQCHRLMDPMRNIFQNKMNYEYRFDSEYSGQLSSFALFNYVNPMRQIGDLGRSIASHPEFDRAWAQKLCVAFNTTKCLETDPEFLRVAQAFRDSNFNFKTLYRELASSNLITASGTSQTSLTSGFYVNRLRKTHFCQNINARVRQIQTARRVTVDGFDNGSRICNDSRVRDAASSLGDDHTVRGLTEVVNSFPLDSFARQSIERACYGMADVVMRRGNAIFSSSENNVRDNLDRVTEYIIGLPRNHPRQMRQVVDIVYNEARNELGLNFGDSMRQTIAFGCTTPDFIGVGL